MNCSSDRIKKKKNHKSKPKAKPQNDSIPFLVKSEKHDSDSDIVDVTVTIHDSIFSTTPTSKSATPPMMSRFKSFPTDVESHPSDSDKHSRRLRESFSSEAKSVRSKLISSLTSDKEEEVEGKEYSSVEEVEFMIDLANSAFALLNLMRADDRELYDAVQGFIFTRCVHLEARKELENGYKLRARAVLAKVDSNHAVKELDKARAEVTALEEKLAKAKEIADALRAKSDELLLKSEALNAELETLKEFEEMEGMARKGLVRIRLRLGYRLCAGIVTISTTTTRFSIRFSDHN